MAFEKAFTDQVTTSLVASLHKTFRPNVARYVKCIILTSIPLTTLLSSCNFTNNYLFLLHTHSIQSYTAHRISTAKCVLSRYLRNYSPLYKWIRYQFRWGTYDTYETLEEEERYWMQAELGLEELSYSDARYKKLERTRSAVTSLIKLPTERQILYYSPRLLPEYRERRHVDLEAQEYHIPVTAFIKWSRLVFPEKPHLTQTQAEKLMQFYSHRDLQQIYRMAASVRESETLQMFDEKLINVGLLCDEVGDGIWKYRKRWKRWLERKGPDIAIIFSHS